MKKDTIRVIITSTELTEDQKVEMLYAMIKRVSTKNKSYITTIPAPFNPYPTYPIYPVYNPPFYVSYDGTTSNNIITT